MAGGKKSKAARSVRKVAEATEPRPWGTVAAVVLVVLFAGGVFGFVYLRYDSERDQQAALARFTPSAEQQDPSRQIPGVVTTKPASANHIGPDQRVAYDRRPPMGGPHDSIWADCSGTVYDSAVRTENMIHGLEHGAVWIAYNPSKVTGGALQSLEDRVEGQNYLTLSPYPGLDKPIALQSWGHQLKVQRPDDPRIDQFIQALRTNQYTHPEVGATCEAPAGAFDTSNPPPFDPTPPGPGAVPAR